MWYWNRKQSQVAEMFTDEQQIIIVIFSLVGSLGIIRIY